MPHFLEHFYFSQKYWLGLYNLFQTFEELDEVKDIPADNQIIREVINGEGGEL